MKKKYEAFSLLKSIPHAGAGTTLAGRRRCMMSPYDHSHWVQHTGRVLLRVSAKSKFMKLAIVCVICLMFLTAIVLLFQALTA